MKALRSFTVRAKLPDALAPLHELAMNLRWSWDEQTRDLFRWVDPGTWEITGHDPVRLLGLASRERLEQLADDRAFMGFLREVHADLKGYLESPRWFHGRSLTDRLYGGGTEHRIRQEILLGIGGVRALDAMGVETQVFHTNEGHAGFLGLERIRRLMKSEGLTIAEAVEAARAGTTFTTHTPVPAGIDRFPRELMERYFTGWVKDCGVNMDDLMALGHF